MTSEANAPPVGDAPSIPGTRLYSSLKRTPPPPRAEPKEGQSKQPPGPSGTHKNPAAQMGQAITKEIQMEIEPIEIELMIRELKTCAEELETAAPVDVAFVRHRLTRCAEKCEGLLRDNPNPTTNPQRDTVGAP